MTQTASIPTLTAAARAETMPPGGMSISAGAAFQTGVEVFL